MAYAPPLPLPAPASMPGVHPSIVGLDLTGLGLLSAEEASSNEQLKFTVRRLACWPLMRRLTPCDACCLRGPLTRVAWLSSTPARGAPAESGSPATAAQCSSEGSR